MSVKKWRRKWGDEKELFEYNLTALRRSAVACRDLTPL